MKLHTLNRLFLLFKNDKLISNSAITLILKLSGIGSNYLLMFLLIKKYGLEAWGSFTLIFTILSLLSMVSGLGLGAALVKFIPSLILNQNTVQAKKIYQKSLIISACFAFLLSFILYLASNSIAQFIFDKPQIADYIKVAALANPFMVIYLLNAQMLRSLKKVSLYTIIFTNSPLFLFLAVFILLDFSNLYGTEEQYVFSLLLYGAVIIALITVILCWILIDDKSESSGLEGTKVSFKTLLNTALPMLLASSIMFIMGWTDILMLGHYVDESQIGIYNIIFKVSSLATISLFAVNSIAAPKLSESYNTNDMTSFKKTIYDSSRLIFVATIPVIIIVFLFSSFILSLFSDGLDAYVSTLRIMILGYFVSAICGSVGYILQMSGNEKFFQRIIFFAAMQNILLNYLLIPHFGLNGAALASTISMSFWNISAVLFIKKKFNIFSIFVPSLKAFYDSKYPK